MSVSPYLLDFAKPLGMDKQISVMMYLNEFSSHKSAFFSDIMCLMIISNESMDFNGPKELDDPQLFDDPSYSMILSYSMIPSYSMIFSYLMIPSYSMINWKYGLR